MIRITFAAIIGVASIATVLINMRRAKKNSSIIDTDHVLSPNVRPIHNGQYIEVNSIDLNTLVATMEWYGTVSKIQCHKVILDMNGADERRIKLARALASRYNNVEVQL